MRILLIGPPGVGKGTQAALLKGKLGLIHLASGDIFRSELKGQTELGKLAKSYMDRGELVPDEVTIQMMAKLLMAPEVKQRGFVLDGFPRTVAQADALDRLLTSVGMKLDKVISIEVPDNIVVKRLSGRLTCPNCGAVYHIENNPPKKDRLCDRCGAELSQRPDDRPETVLERLRVFQKATAPVIAYYEKKSLLARVDGSRSPEDVNAEILKGVPA